jgi:hypothetical protein
MFVPQLVNALMVAGAYALVAIEAPRSPSAC